MDGESVIQPDYRAAAVFIAALAGSPAAPCTFQTFHDSVKDRKDVARVFHGTLASNFEELVALNKAGAGAYLTISETDLKGRKLANVVGLRALFVDHDDGEARETPLQPSIVVRSGHGLHRYWLLKPGELLERFAPALLHLAAYYKSDTNILGLNRVMRIPGFWHQKGQPFRVDLVDVRPQLKYTIDEVLTAHPIEKKVDPPKRAHVVKANRTPSDDDLEKRIFRAKRYCEKIDGAVSGQNGHHDTWNTAIKVVRGFNLTPSAAFEVLAEAYNPRCIPPWSDDELIHKIEGATHDSKLPIGFLLEKDGRGASPRGAVPRPAAKAPELEEPEPDDAPVAAPADAVRAMLTSGEHHDKIIPVLALIADPVEREILSNRLAYERKISKTVLKQALRLANPRRKLLSLVKREGPDRPGAPTIVIEPGKLHETVVAAEAALISSAGAEVYQRTGTLVRLYRTESLALRRSGEVERPIGALVIRPLDTPYLLARLTAAAHWRKIETRSQELVACDAPEQVCSVLLSMAGEWTARPMLGIIEAPTIRPDGSILQDPGYDEATGLVYDPGQAQFSPISEKPTIEEARAAMTRLTDLLEEFPFVSKVDRSVAISAILTALVRKSLPSAPMHAFTAPKMRTGKTMLADVVALLATGRPCPVLPPNALRPEEEKKRLLAVLLGGDAVICYDNIERPFGDPAICQALTQQVVSDRILGESRQVYAPTNATFLATGNNLTFTGDITVRVLLSRLDPQLEHPEERTFTRDIAAYALKHRAELVAAALTTLVAHRSGCLGVYRPNLKNWAGFGEWQAMVAGTIVAYGMPDPADSRREVEDKDSTRSYLGEVMLQWWNVFNDRPVTLTDVMKCANISSNEELRQTLLQCAGDHAGREINPRTFTNYVIKNVGRIERGMQIRAAGTAQGVRVWRVIKGIERFQCKSCDGTEFRLSKKTNTQICTTCWPEG
ncbi:MAG: hypothetical protein EPN91_02355 [Salinibacterium sp.]|nr:MAG: hypothetical protein EPN91_02355 [Salinibacterium sp.]